MADMMDDEDGEEEEGPLSELVEIDEDEPGDVEETEDGGAMVALAPSPIDANPEHFANLAIGMSPTRLANLGATLCELVEQDKESRKKRDEQYEEGIRRTGLGDDAPGGAQFTGASRVVHPMLTEACVDFSSRAMKEIFPASGPAKPYIPGTPTQERVFKGRRKVKHINWQLTVQSKSFRSELEQCLTQVPLAGVGYMKIMWDRRLKRINAIFVPVDDIFLPFAASGFYSAERKTHRQTITQEELDRRIASGLYRDVELDAAPAAPTPTKPAEANEKVEGKSDTGLNVDGQREIYEIYLNDNYETVEETDDAELLPNIVTVDAQTHVVLAIYRNWDPEDEAKEELTHIVEFPMVPWRGAYPIGLTHMIGGLSGTATGALRALLDAAHINNFPGAMKLKGGGKGGGNNAINPTQVTEIEGSVMGDDIRKLIMPIPFNPPSPILFQLLGFVVDAGKGVVRTTFEDLPNNSGPNMPVGTTLALIEQGTVVFSAIHSRLHAAMQRTLDVVCRLNRTYLEDQEVKDAAGEVLAHRTDYDGPDDVVPVSDPNIFSETQRFAQAQAVIARSDTHMELYNQPEVERAFLERLKIPAADIERFLKKIPKPHPMNAVNENVAAMAQRPLQSFPEQDHLAHLQVHLSFIQSPVFGMNQLIAPTVLPILLHHIQEHMGMWYITSVYNMTMEVGQVPPESLMDKDPRVAQEFDKLMAVVSNKVLEEAPQVFAKIPGITQAAQQLLKSLLPPPMQDPSQAAAQASAAETQRKAQADQVKAQNDNQKNALEQQKAQAGQQKDAAQLQLDQQRLELEKEKLGLQEHEQQTSVQIAARQQLLEAEAARNAAQASVDAADRQAQAQREKQQSDASIERMVQDEENRRKELDMISRAAMNDADNQTAVDLAEMEIESGEKIAVSTGTGLNPQP